MGVSTVTAAVIGGTAAAAGYAAGYFVRASAEEPNVEEVATIHHCRLHHLAHESN